MAFFIGVVHRAQVMAARDSGVVAFSHGRESAVRNMKVGDRVIYYAPKSDLQGDAVQAFVAHATVTGDAPRQKAWSEDFTAWVRDAEYDAVTETPVRPLLESLSFVKNKQHWGMTFRGGKFEIPSEDYARIAGAMLGGAS